MPSIVQPSLTVPPQIAVTVIIATYQGASRISGALDSLAAQTLDSSCFEILVIRNGADDGTDSLVNDFIAQQPGLSVRLLQQSEPNFSAALNRGLIEARGEYFTFLDDDDTLTAPYLAAMLDLAGPNRLVCAPVGDISTPGEFPEYDNYLNRSFFRLIGADGDWIDASQAGAANGAKMAPTAIGRLIKFDTTLHSGMDTLYWNRLLAEHQLRVVVVPPGLGAAYLRLVRPGSMSRAFSDQYVADRYAVAAALAELGENHPAQYDAIRICRGGQAGNLGRMLRNHPERRASELKRLFAEQPLGMNTAHAVSAASDLLACVYVFAPYNDISAITAIKRLRGWAEPFDAITANLSMHRQKDPTLDQLLMPWLGKRNVTRGTAAFQGVRGPLRYARRGWERIAERMSSTQAYGKLYSRSMWPASHVLAALIKLRHPEVNWLAEFSDPIAMGWDGPRRHFPLKMEDAVVQELNAGLAAAGLPWQQDHGLFAWVEQLALALADRVMFTNQQQKEFMLGYQPDRALAERGAAVSEIAYHPVPDPACYEMVSTQFMPTAGRINIGYFGSFYGAVRGPADLMAALAELPVYQRKRFAMHLFVPDPPEALAVVKRLGLAKIVKVSGYRPYLEMLAICRKMDWLVVADYRVSQSHGINPYLPAKYSDYCGSGSQVWGLVEPGSTLDNLPLAAKTTLGDQTAAVRHLKQLLS
ncbi:MAG: glycosyltransferase [Bifidobacteriaceae bacterium]|jgi:hypothetical protein|nr:glycosyltransferase [Bifidobacteriaceae bacterium]